MDGPLNEASCCAPTDVARRLNVHRNTVYRWIESGHLPAFQLGGGAQRIRVASPRTRFFMSAFC